MATNDTPDLRAQPPDLTATDALLTFDPDQKMAWRGEEPLAIEPKGMEVLALLAREPGTIVSSETLQRSVWRRRHLGEGVISQTIYKLRRALDEDGLIESVRGQGWRLTRPLARPTYNPDRTAAEPPSTAGLDEIVVGSGAEFEQARGSWHDSAATTEPQTRTTAPPLPRWRVIMGVLVAALVVFVVGAAVWRGPSDQPEVPVIAVMPFQFDDSDQALSPVAIAVRDRLAMDVQSIPPFKVTAEDAITAYTGSPRDADQMRALLGANVILRGRVAQLAGSGQGFELSIWVDDFSGNGLQFEKRYENGSGDIASVLDRIRIDVFALLAKADRERDTNARGTSNPEAWSAYVQAASLASANSPDSDRRALASLERAVELDPNFAEAWAELGGLLGSRLFSPDDGSELKASRARSLAAMDRAIALSPDFVGAILMRSELRNIYAFDWSGAAADVALAERLVGQPRADVLSQQARLAAALGDLEAAVAINEQAHTLDPLSGARRNAGWHLLALGDYAKARRYLLSEHRIRPWESSLNFYLGLCDVYEGQPRDALKRFQYADSDYRLTGIAIAHIALGDQAEADRILGILIARMPDQAAYEIASVYGFANQADEAFRWLDHAFDVGDGALEYLAYDPRFRSLRDDPRMHERLRRLKHPKWVDGPARDMSARVD